MSACWRFCQCRGPLIWRNVRAVQRCRRGARLFSVNTIRSAGSSPENPFNDKYKEKLEKVQGPLSDGGVVNEAEPTSSSGQTSWEQPTASFYKAPDLNSIMKMELMEDENAEEITQIWVEYHKTKDCVCAVIPMSKYVQFHTKATHCPRFVYPLPRGDGCEMWYSQFTSQRCYFTSLINYQRYQENAPIALTLAYFTEFMESKGIVLIQGEVDTAHLSVMGAQNLVHQLQLYYSSEDAERYSLVHTFNHQPQDFDYRLLLEQLNNLTMAT